jgi:hypothetical protein
MNIGPYLAIAVLCGLPLAGMALGWWAHGKVSRYGWQSLLPDFGRLWRAFGVSARQLGEHQKQIKNKRASNEREIYSTD